MRTCRSLNPSVDGRSQNTYTLGDLGDGQALPAQLRNLGAMSLGVVQASLVAGSQKAFGAAAKTLAKRSRTSLLAS